MRAPLARWHGPGGPPGRGAATGPRAPRPGRETAVGRAPAWCPVPGWGGRPCHLWPPGASHRVVEKRRADGITTPGRTAACRRGE